MATTILGPSSNRYEDFDPCWPPGLNGCASEEITTNEKNDLTSLASEINYMGHYMCDDVQSYILDALQYNRVQVWTAGPPGYNPDTHDGDIHSLYGVIHVSYRWRGDDYWFIRLLIHEAAHAFGINEGDATMMEEACAPPEMLAGARAGQGSTNVWGNL